MHFSFGALIGRDLVKSLNIILFLNLINEMSNFSDMILKDSLKKSWNIYLHGKKNNSKQTANSRETLFLYTAGRYCTVGTLV